MIEGTIPNARHTAIGGNHTSIASRNQGFACSFNQAIARTVINRIAGIHRDRGETVAPREGTIPNARHAIWDRDSGETVAV